MWLPPDPAPVTPAKASEDNSPEEEDADQAHSKFRKYRTELCKFWQNGACTRGFQCTFAHSVGELRDSASTERGARQVPEFPSRKSEERPGSSSKYKTAFCRYWQQGNSCKRGTDCTFAHSPSELRLLADTPAEGPSAEWTDAPRKYKTQFCRYWQTGSCTWGSDCTFAHSPKELRQEGQRTEGQRTEASKTPQYGPGSFRPGYLPPEIGDMSPLSGQWKDLRDGSETKGLSCCTALHNWLHSFSAHGVGHSLVRKYWTRSRQGKWDRRRMSDVRMGLDYDKRFPLLV
jgi:hypothetical protein